ncbi:MAG TPA: hypothetical protein VGK67_07515 [Myxococcales bacterium]|jgi:hypothetical protein
MPVKNDPAALRALLTQKLADKALTQAEADEVATAAEQDGVTAEEGAAVVDGMVEALQADSLDLTGADSQAAANSLLGKLDAATPLPLDKSGAEPLPSGTVNFTKLLSMQAEAKVQKLPAASFDGKALGVDKKGEVTLDRRRVGLDLKQPSDATVSALWGLARPDQLTGLSEAGAAALQKNLAASVAAASVIEPKEPGKFNRMASVCAGTAVLGELAAKWSPETVDAMLQIAEKSPSVMTQALAVRGLQAAPLSDEQKAKLAALKPVEGGADLLAAFDKARTEQQKAGWENVKGPAAELTLSSFTFAKSGEAVTNFMTTLKAWDQLNPNYGETLNAEEVGKLKSILDNYVQTSEQNVFVFGTLSNNAPKDVAGIVSERTVAEITPGLKAEQPGIGGVALTREQADFVLSIAPNLRDKRSVEQLAQALGVVQGAFEQRLPSTWETPKPPAKLDEAAFALFQRAAIDYQDAAGASPDGKLGYDDLVKSLRAQVNELQPAIAPRLAELKATPPTWDGVQVSPECATYLEAQLRDHLKSAMSVDNLGRALKVYAGKSGGKVDGETFTKFQSMLEEYKGQWPELKTFDFNKLERIATFKVDGKEVPLCKLNGKPVGLADFYNTVATNVSGAIDKSLMKYDWQGDRWGYRAKQLVELMDVVAEQTVRGEGPVALLQQQNPGKTVEILATGADGGHAQLLYSVKDKSGKETARYAQGSDGALAKTTESGDPILVSATVGKDGDLNATVAKQIKTTRWPLQNPYTVGDRIDVNYQDGKVEELEDEGKPFSTRYKVLEAEITGYDAKGKYTVKFKTPEGEEKTQTLSLSDIRKANNPHYFNPKGSQFSDVSINVNTDAALKEFLDGAQPIIDAHLPKGSTATLTPKELVQKQKACIDALMKYASRIKYPSEGANVTDPGSKAFLELEKGYMFPLGELAKIDRGVCRHQCIFEHLLLQQAGIDSRLASGAANTSGNAFRGYHIWTEVTLADNERYLSDQTWDDPYIPLWKGAYSVDRQRQEMYDRTARYDSNLVN